MKSRKPVRANGRELDALVEHALRNANFASLIHAPSVRLIIAVLQQAVSDLRGEFTPGSEEARCAGALKTQARGWLESRETDYLFSFRQICSVLGLDRKGILSLLTEEREKAGE